MAESMLISIVLTVLLLEICFWLLIAIPDFFPFEIKRRNRQPREATWDSNVRE